MSGRLRNIECLPRNQGLVLELQVEQGTLRLLLDKPESIEVRGGTGNTVDLSCGAQNQPITIGFTPADNATHRTEGTVRVLDFTPVK